MRISDWSSDVCSSDLMGLVLLPLLPTLSGLGRGVSALAVAALVGTVLFAALAVLRPAFDADVPRPLNLVYAGIGDEARVFVNAPGTFPEEFLNDARFRSENRRAGKEGYSKCKTRWS